MLQFSRVKEYADRPSTLLENGQIRVLINDAGGMTPEFSLRQGRGYQNAHWMPIFRATGDLPYREQAHQAHWKAKLLHSIAGNFPCAPSFGAGPKEGPVDHPPHGYAANEVWRHRTGGVHQGHQAAYAIFDLPSPSPEWPVDMKKIDLVMAGHCVHYTALRFDNRSAKDQQVTLGFHNTIGSPFLQSGCVISLCADRFATPPLGGEFDDTGRLMIGAEFDSLKKAPLREGGTVDLSVVPGMIGYTDFVSGRVPKDALLGWSAVVNPVQRLVYGSFFPGPASASGEEIALGFNDLWMQYGGRNFTPWAAYEGAPDATFCLGAENATGAFATGLDNARKVGRVLGVPTTATVPAKGSRVLYYATLYAPYEGDSLSEGVMQVRRCAQGLCLVGSQGQETILPADPGFAALRAVDAM